MYVQSGDVRFAVLQLISAARNELGLIRNQSAQTATGAVGICCIYVISKNRAGLLYRYLKHEAIAECFRPDKARTESFLNVL